MIQPERQSELAPNTCAHFRFRVHNSQPSAVWLFKDCSNILNKLVIIVLQLIFDFCLLRHGSSCWVKSHFKNRSKKYLSVITRFFILFRLHSLQQCVCVYVLCDASTGPLCCQKKFLSFQEFHAGLMSECTAIRLWLHHETYFAEMFTPDPYNN